MKWISKAGAIALLLAAHVSQAGAGEIIGGSALLDATSHAQLESWLGAGEFDLYNIYTRQAGDTSDDFHHAADGKGATFSLMRVTNPQGVTYLVGGYDPLSWASAGGWHFSASDAERSGFLFNLSDAAVYRQVSASYILPSQGRNQTYNDINFGPTFGIGHDLYLNESLDWGYSWQVTYGDPADEGKSIVDRSLGAQIFTVSAIEVFSITSPVPEPASYGLLLAGLCTLGSVGWGRRRRAGSA